MISPPFWRAVVFLCSFFCSHDWRTPDDVDVTTHNYTATLLLYMSMCVWESEGLIKKRKPRCLVLSSLRSISNLIKFNPTGRGPTEITLCCCYSYPALFLSLFLTFDRREREREREREKEYSMSTTSIFQAVDIMWPIQLRIYLNISQILLFCQAIVWLLTT